MGVLERRLRKLDLYAWSFAAQQRGGTLGARGCTDVLSSMPG